MKKNGRVTRVIAQLLIMTPVSVAKLMVSGRRAGKLQGTGKLQATMALV